MQRYASVLLLLALTACNAPNAVVPPASIAFETTLPLGPDAVWRDASAACRDGDAAVGDCLRKAMEAGGASDAALAVNQQLSDRGETGYVSGWDTVDGVGVATTEFPFRANTNQGTWLVDAAARVVDVDALDDMLADTQSGDDEDITAFRAAHPDALPFAPAVAAGTEPLADRGVRLVFATPMRTCHACADVGTVRVGYDFDEARRFSGRHLISLH